jgi:hypothetical protein
MNEVGETIGAQGINESLIGNTEAAEILGVRTSNVRKMLVRYGVEGQLIYRGSRPVHVYPRIEVERVQELRKTRKRKRKDVNRA